MRWLPAFYKSETEFVQIHHQLKQTPCPHCQRLETLNLHGTLKGYCVGTSRPNTHRGHRVFCSNRGRRGGCGRTFSVLLAKTIKNFIINTTFLWRFFARLLITMNVIKAFKQSTSGFSTTSAYRMIQRVRLKQPAIRSLLSRKRARTHPGYKADPLTETIHHLHSAFEHEQDPVAAFQLYFQTPFI